MIIEDTLMEIWSNALDINILDINDGFLDLGGHSLTAVGLEILVQKEFNICVPFYEILENMTILQMAEKIRNAEKNTVLQIPVSPKQSYYPLAWSQKWVYFISQKNRDDTGFNLPRAFLIEGQIDILMLKRAFQTIIKRHEVLRTSFHFEDNRIYQKIHEQVDFNINILKSEPDKIDLNNLRQPFELEHAPLIRAFLIEISDCKHILFIECHHIIIDGYSFGLLLRELADIYNEVELLDLPVSFKDYAVFQKNMEGTEGLKVRENYWMDQFAEEVPLLSLPGDYSKKPQHYKGKKISYVLSDKLLLALKELAISLSTTLNNLLFSVYYILMNRYSGQDDMVVGFISSGKSHADLEHTIGMFVKALPIRVSLNQEMAFCELAEMIKDKLFDTYINQEVDFDNIIQKLGTDKRYSVNALFNTIYCFHHEQEARRITFGDSHAEYYPFELNSSEMDIELNVFYDSKVTLVVEFNENKFQSDTIANMFTHYENLLCEIARKPNIKLANLNMLNSEEVERLLALNPSNVNYERDVTFHQLFENTVKKYSDTVAIVEGEKSITYNELNKRANRLAYVLRAKNVAKENVVGIIAKRSIASIVGVIAIIKAGGAFLCIDTTFPDEKAKYILRNSGASILLTNENPDKYTYFFGEIIDIGKEELYTGEGANLVNINKANDMLYVCYTSGTTGYPKGAIIDHKGLISSTFACLDKYRLNEYNFLQASSFSVDLFALDLATVFIGGGKLVICSKDTLINFPKLYQLMQENQINLFDSTPSLVIPFMEYVYEKGLPSDFLEILNIGSDVCPLEHFRTINERFGEKIRIMNWYGVTEASVASSVYEAEVSMMPEEGNTPIGKPIQNTKFYIMNDYFKLQPVNVVGELYIAGDGLARGYINNPDLTKERFLDNPYIEGEIMYKTGDLARWKPDGNVDFIGRDDFQIKIRGYRVELGEIENCILKYDHINEVAVVQKTDKNLVAFYVSDIKISFKSIKEYLSLTLLPHAIPDHFVQIDKIPLTLNGKVDRNVLNSYEVDFEERVGDTQHELPSNIVEEKVLLIWKDLLDNNEIRLGDNFFEIGGNSLKVISVIRSVQKEFGVNLPLVDILNDLTIKNISNFIIKEKLEGRS